MSMIANSWETKLDLAAAREIVARHPKQPELAVKEFLNYRPNYSEAEALALLEAARNKHNPDGSDWRQRAKNFSQLTAVEPKHIIEGLIPEKALIFLTGASFGGKTFLAFESAHAIMTGSKFLSYFEVSTSYPVFYHCPEMAEAWFRQRGTMFRFDRFSDPDIFLCRTMDDGPPWPLTSNAMKLSAKGRVVYLDTAMYFNTADDTNSYTQALQFAKDSFALLEAGAISIIALYHPPKFAKSQDEMTLENYILGSAGYGGLLGSCIGVRCLNEEKLHIYIQQLKARGSPVKPFQVEGFPAIKDTGHFKMLVEPSKTSPYLRDVLAGADPATIKAYAMFDDGDTYKKIAKATGISTGKLSKLHGQWEKAGGQERQATFEGADFKAIIAEEEKPAF